MQVLQLTPLLSVTIGSLVLFIWKRLNLELPLLKRFSIPEPVSGGLLVAILMSLLHIAGGPELRFGLDSRDFLVVFPLMGRDYDAAVICAGCGGISLGSTPTAMANMTAVTQQYEASSRAFLIVPLAYAFFSIW